VSINQKQNDKVRREAVLSEAHGSTAPFVYIQSVSMAEWDKHSPPWDRMGECIVVNQENGPDHCESGWMVTVMAKDGTTKRLDSHWITPNEKVQR